MFAASSPMIKAGICSAVRKTTVQRCINQLKLRESLWGMQECRLNIHMREENFLFYIFDFLHENIIVFYMHWLLVWGFLFHVE